MHIFDAPLLGRPLAGKTTILLRTRDALGGQLHAVDFTVEEDGPFHGAACRLLTLHVKTPAAHGQLWCVPGGCGSQWVVPLLPRDSPAVFVFDGQAETFDWFDAVKPHVDLARSIVIVTKRDLSADPSSAIHPELRGRPFLPITAIDARCAPQVGAFLGEYFGNFAQAATARPLQERAALTGVVRRE